MKLRSGDLPQTIEGWVDYTQTLHKRSIDMGLERVSEVLRRLELSHPGDLVVAIAGTNGKGSSVSFLENIAACQGLSTGAYTSPHLVRFNERIRVNQQQVSDTELLEAFNQVEQARGDISLTYFEYATLTAAWIFQQAQLDVVCLEVGLGGRLDAVRAFDADIALITSIGLDHQSWLGGSREQIGFEKAGIMMPGKRAVCADGQPPQSVIDFAAEQHVDLWCRGQEFGITQTQTGGDYWERDAAGNERVVYQELPPPGIPGTHQWSNLAGVLAAIRRIPGEWTTNNEPLHQGIATATLPGRLQTFASTPPVVVDVAHNIDAARSLRDYIQLQLDTGQLPPGRCIAVVGMLADKAVEEIINALDDVVDHWITATLAVDRGLTDKALADRLSATGSNTTVTIGGDPVSALALAREHAGDVDWLLVFGSFHTAGEIVNALLP